MAIKSTLQHGQWIPWVEEHLPFGINQAGKYMKIHKERELLNSHSGVNLAINRAIEILSTPKPKKEPVKVEAELVDEEKNYSSMPQRSKSMIFKDLFGALVFYPE